MAEFVTVCEVGPRDGLQIAKAIMPTDIKHRWIAALAASGLPQIEVGSFVPPKLIPQMADTDAVVRQEVLLPQGGNGLEIVALAPNLRGAMAAYDAGAQRISIPVSVSQG
ncbi:MAG: hydroxymethylglutaryl-CoA lyase, partial [Acetobacteraceae bacterium]|nr:hydroxymethylglutaryl-CoA lyase [Acetobacteraceae bacterium]